MIQASFLLWGALTGIEADGQLKPINIDSAFSYLMLHSHAQYFMAPEDTFTLEKIRSLPDEAFRPVPKAGFFFGLQKSGYWIRFAIKAEDANKTKANLLLEVVNPYIENLQYFLLKADGEVEIDTALGADFPFAERYYSHRNWQIPLELAAGDSVLCLLHFPPGRSPLQFDLYLSEHSNRLARQELENIILTSYFIILLVFLTLIFLVNRIARFRSLWFYAVYVALGALLVFSSLGLSYQHLWPENPLLHQASNLIISNLFLIAGLQFVRTYFDTPGFFPLINRVMITVMGIAAAFIPFAMLHPYTPLRFSHLLHFLHYLAFLVGFASAIAVFVMSIVRQQRILAGWFLFGFSLHGMGILLTILQYISWFPVASSTHWLYNWGLPLAFYPQLAMMAGALVEVPVLLYVAFYRFRKLYDDAQKQARSREENLNDLVMSIEQERRRLGQDLHDTLGVQMAAIKMRLSMLHEKITDSQAQELELVIRDLDQTYQEMRTISQNLMPPSLERQGLAVTIEGLLSRLQSAKPNLETHFFYNAPLGQLSPKARLHLYRILLELITNAIKHADAKELSVQLTRYDDRMLVTVEDNGRGFDAHAKKNGMGLKNIAYRVKALGGTIALDTQPGRGTTVAIEIPLEKVLMG